MKDDFLHKGIQGLRGITLSPEEKRAVLSRLSEYIEKHPPVAALRERRVFGWFVPAFRYAVSSILIVLFAAGGSVAVAAEGALPDDILYPVKVRIVEPLRGALVAGDVPKARWEAEKMVRRLEETETLAAQGRLDRASVQAVTFYFEESAAAFNAHMRNAEAKELSEEFMNASVDFEAEIRAHAQILSIIREHAGSLKSDDIAPLQSVVEESVHKAWERRINAAGREDGEARRLFDDRMRSVQSMIKETKTRLESTKASAAAGSPVQKDILERVSRELQKAEDAIKDAKEKRDSGDSSEAFSALLDSESATKQADTSLQQGLKFGEEESESQSRQQSGSGPNGGSNGNGSSGRDNSNSGRSSDGTDR